jgi:hypothetical protein
VVAVHVLMDGLKGGGGGWEVGSAAVRCVWAVRVLSYVNGGWVNAVVYPALWLVDVNCCGRVLCCGL